MFARVRRARVPARAHACTQAHMHAYANAHTHMLVRTRCTHTDACTMRSHTRTCTRAHARSRARTPSRPPIFIAFPPLSAREAVSACTTVHAQPCMHAHDPRARRYHRGGAVWWRARTHALTCACACDAHVCAHTQARGFSDAVRRRRASSSENGGFGCPSTHAETAPMRAREVQRDRYFFF